MKVKLTVSRNSSALLSSFPAVVEFRLSQHLHHPASRCRLFFLSNIYIFFIFITAFQKAEGWWFVCYTIGILRMEEIKFFTFEGSIPRLRPDHRIDLHDEIQRHSAQTFFFNSCVSARRPSLEKAFHFGETCRITNASFLSSWPLNSSFYYVKSSQSWLIFLFRLFSTHFHMRYLFVSYSQARFRWNTLLLCHATTALTLMFLVGQCLLTRAAFR